jgi:DNA-binding transcriptional LysR family regulator
MDLNRLALFVRVVDTGSFTAAAVAMGMRKSSVSRGVAKLEEELGVKLLHRTTRRLTLTDAGRSYVERVRESMQGVDDATALVREMGHEPQGLVRVTAVPEFGQRGLADLVVRFLRRYPKISIELVLTSRAVDLVEEKVDIAIRAGVLRDSSLVARKILVTDLQLFAAPSYLLRRGTPKKLSDLAKHDFVLYRPQAGKNVIRLSGPKGDESVEVSGPLGADDLLFNRNAVAAGAGISLLPALSVAKHVERGEMVRVLPAYDMHGGANYVVSPEARQQLTRVKLLRDFLVANLPSMFDSY